MGMSELPFPELFARIRPELELKGSGQPDPEGWVTARCIDAANHRNGDEHFSMRVNAITGGVACMSQGCAVGPNLNNLAERLVVNGHTPDGSDDPLERLALERMLPRCWRCDKKLAESVARPWEIRCVRCKAKNVQPA